MELVSVCEADNADRLEPIRDSRELPHHELLILKAADAVMEQKNVLTAMHLRKKGAQGVNIRLAIETIHGGPPVASLLLPIHIRFDDDKKREEPLREDRCGREDLVHGHIPHQLVLRLVQPVHQLGVAGGPIVSGHSAAFLWNLEMPDLTRLAGRLTRARRTRAIPQIVGHTGTNVQKSSVTCTRAARGNFPRVVRTETQFINQCRVGGWSRSFWTAGGEKRLAARRRRALLLGLDRRLRDGVGWRLRDVLGDDLGTGDVCRLEGRDMRMKGAITRPNSFLLLIVFLAGVFCGATPASDKTIYSNTSNKELKQKALQLVKSIRELVDAYNKKDRELLDEYGKKDNPKRRIDERKAMRDQWLKASDAVHDAAMRSYKENYWADAILLRNELYRRLPNQPNQKDVALIYQIPTNVLGIGLIADHLELLAKSLPDS
jgi:hypothetical protein